MRNKSLGMCLVSFGLFFPFMTSANSFDVVGDGQGQGLQQTIGVATSVAGSQKSNNLRVGVKYVSLNVGEIIGFIERDKKEGRGPDKAMPSYLESYVLKGNGFAGNNQTCVRTAVTTNSGITQTTSWCTVDYPTRSQMFSSYYPASGLSVVSYTNTTDVVKAAADNNYWLGFYTPAGRLSELVNIINNTQ